MANKFKFPRSFDEWVAKNSNTPPPRCVVCGAQAKFIGGKSAFRETCGGSCGTKLGQRRLLEKNQVHPSQTTEAQSRRKQTNLLRYGSTTALQQSHVKQKAAARQADEDVKTKIAHTFQKRYGVASALQHPYFLAKQKETTRERYGASNAMQSKDVVERNQLKNREKYLQTEFLTKRTRLTNAGFVDVFLDGYHGTGVEYTWNHRCGLTFSQQLPSNGGLPRCPSCHTTGSMTEMILKQQLEDMGEEVVLHDRSVLAPREIDLWLPQRQVAIEINGEYWHSGRTHLDKRRALEKRNIKLFNFWALEVEQHLSKVVNIIRSNIGTNEIRLAARKLSFAEISEAQSERFINEFHLQGNARGSILRLGAFDGDQLQCVATFCRSRFDKTNQVELLRFCVRGNTSVAGALSKMVTAAKMQLNVQSIITYSDKRYSENGAYAKIGKLVRETKPGYVWFGYVKSKGWVKLNRLATQKHKLPALLGDSFNPSETEQQNMIRNGWLQLFDDGQQVFIL